MIVIRTEREEDYLTVYALNKLAFGGEDEACLVERIRETDGFIPELSLVAVKDESVVGHILFSPININYSGGDVAALSLAPMAVLPETQKQGIGSLLIEKGIEKARKLGSR